MTKREIISEIRPTALFADGFDDAIIGYCENTGRVIYSIDRCMEILMYTEDMDREDAIDHLSYNVIGGYVGEMTPIWMRELDFT